MVAIENIFVKYIKLREKLNEAKIYKITDNTNNNVYIGSTCDSLKKDYQFINVIIEDF